MSGRKIVDPISELNSAASAGDLEKIEGLYSERKVFTSETDSLKDNKTALYQAVTHGHAGVVNFLLEHGADPLAKTKPLSIVKAAIALDFATCPGKKAMIERLLTHPRIARSGDKETKRSLESSLERMQSLASGSSSRSISPSSEGALAGEGSKKRSSLIFGRPEITRTLVNDQNPGALPPGSTL